MQILRHTPSVVDNQLVITDPSAVTKLPNLGLSPQLGILGALGIGLGPIHFEHPIRMNIFTKQ